MTEKEYFEVHASQAEFLDWYHKQALPQYEKPSVTVDMVAYCFVEGKMKLFLIRRKAHPFQNCLALVGGFMDKGEDAAHACQREVKEEINLELPLEKIEQLVTVSTPDRDPRGGQLPLPTWFTYLVERLTWLRQEMMQKKSFL